MSDDDEEYHSTIVGDHTYVQKSGRCFNVHRDGYGLHLAPGPIFVSVEIASTFALVIKYMMEKVYS